MSANSSSPVDVFGVNLAKGQACNACRKRKLRCNGARPVCSSCEAGRRKKLQQMRKKGVKEEELESIVFAPCYESGEDGQKSRSKRSRTSLKETASKFDGQTPKSSMDKTQHASTSQSSTLDAAAAAGRTLLSSEIEEPLPPPERLRYLVDVFLESYSDLPLFQPARLRERLAKDPFDRDYPQPCALHVMLAIAYAQHPELDHTLNGEAPDSRKGAHYRHTRAAAQSISNILHNGMSFGFLDITRALLLLAYKQFGSGDVIESYVTTSSAIRSCIMLGLNRNQEEEEVNSKQFFPDLLRPRIPDATAIKSDLADEIDKEERRRTMIAAFATDRNAMFSTLWPGTLTEEDYTGSFPQITRQQFLDGSFLNDKFIKMNPLTLQSPDFFSRKPIDAEQLQIKGMVLLGRCTELIFRIPRKEVQHPITSTPTFKRLESYIAAHSLTASSIVDPSGVSSTTNSTGALATYLTRRGNVTNNIYKKTLIVSTLIPYACTLTLHEPFANFNSESEAACVGACQSALSILKIYSFHASEEVTKLNTTMSHIIALVGRSLIRQLELFCSRSIVQNFPLSYPQLPWDTPGFTDSVSLLHADLEVIFLILRRLGQHWPVALRQYDALLKLLHFNPDHRLRGLFAIK